MKICPSCASENIFFSKKRNRFFCEDCEHGFNTPAHSKGMRLFLSYGHDKNATVVQKIKEELLARGYDVWIDTSEIPAGKDWRERITNGLIGCNGVLSFLSRHSVRDPGVCLDELRIAVCLKRAYVKTVLLESRETVEPPELVRHTQWIDMSDWDTVPAAQWGTYFSEKIDRILEALNSDEAIYFNEELKRLSLVLGNSDNNAAEQRLLKQPFVGRRWLTQRIMQWSQAPTSTPFMLFGVPGAGKSTFAANFSRLNPDVLAVIFFEWDHKELHNPTQVIRTLAFKLAATLPDYRRMLCSLLSTEQDIKRMKQYTGAALMDWLILDPLHCCIVGNRSTGILVLDGLDETSPEVAELLLQKASCFPQWIKVLFTSRYDSTVATLFRDAETVLLDRELGENQNDLKEYLALRLNCSSESETVNKLANKSEGSFMYAAAFCNAVENGTLTPKDVSTVPMGLNNFYRTFFKRLFPTREAFLEMRPFLELLCTEDELPEELLAAALQTDHYGLWELRLNVQSLVTATEGALWKAHGVQYKKFRFSHQSLREWLTDPALAGEFYIDAARGYRRLANYSKNALDKPTPSVQDSEITELVKYLSSIDPQKATAEDWKEAQQRFAESAAKTEASRQKEAYDKGLLEFLKDHQVKWLILGKEYEKARKMLLDSFDRDTMLKEFDSKNYTEYYRFYTLWQWADLFPAEEPIGDLIDKLTEIVLFPKEHGVGHYSHRSRQISMLLLCKIMDSARFAKVFFALVESFPFHNFFTSAASDDIGETRDGWDKYYTARDAAICLKKLDAAGVSVPKTVRNACESAKLTYNFENGKDNEGMFSGGENGCWKYGILSEAALYKDLCLLAEPTEPLVRYNTLSLQYFLVHGTDEDPAFIRRCLEHYADLPAACRNALEDLKTRPAHTAEPRMTYIRSLL